MTLSNKNKTFASKLEFLIVAVSLIAILIPLRILSREIFADGWIASLGLITLVFGIILFLAKKEKIGVFGRMFIRQITKTHQGKKKLIVYSQTILFLSVGLFTIFSIHSGNHDYYDLKQQVIEELHKQGILVDSNLNYDAIHKITSQITPNQQIGAITALPILSVQDFKVFSVVLAVTDHLMGGWVMYFWQVMIIECIEFSVFLGISKRYFLKNINH
ncbi:hypothetical protein [Candidatus Nitrosarchaeum limnium]|jgi:MFS family permease|nr:hypothetical protein [Candidatus Nitrosarchaeum limnium]